MCVNVQTYRSHMRVCVCVYMYVCMYICMFVYICECVRVYIHLYMFVYIYVYTYVYTAVDSSQCDDQTERIEVSLRARTMIKCVRPDCDAVCTVLELSIACLL